MVDFTKMTLEEMEEKGLIDLKVPINTPKIPRSKNKNSIIGNLSNGIKALLLVVLLLLLFGIFNIPVYIWYFFYK